MLPRIESKLFKNDFYEVKGVNTQKCSISFVDFQYSAPPTNSNWGTISPNSYNKTFNLKQLKITVPSFLNFNDIKDVYLIYQTIKHQIDKEYFKKITDLGEQHRINGDIKIDITHRQLDKGDPHRIIFSRLINASNYLATEGRIGPAQWITSNKKTYNFFLSYLKDINLSYDQNNNLIIGNIKYIINDLIDDDIVLLGRNNNIDGPGVRCFFLTDERDNLIINEIMNPASMNKDLIIHYAVEDFGAQPHLQYFKINTKDISYYRYLKLKKIKETYNE